MARLIEYHQYPRMPNHFIDLAHVKDCRQSAFPRKRIHQKLMHSLRNQTSWQANKRHFTGAYVVGDQPRRFRIPVWIAVVIHSANA